MQFNLLGFTQESGFRVFAFECVASDKTKTSHVVRVDLALSQKHGIRIQELPLLCRCVLERGVGTDQSTTVTFTENEMLVHEQTCADVRAAALLKKKAPRRPMPSTVDTGNGWRGSLENKVAPIQLQRPITSNS